MTCFYLRLSNSCKAGGFYINLVPDALVISYARELYAVDYQNVSCSDVTPGPPDLLSTFLILVAQT